MLRFNFAERRETVYGKYIKPDLIFLLIVLAVVFFGTSAYTRAVKKDIERIQVQISRLNHEINRLHRIQREEKELMSLKEEFKRKLKVVSRLDQNRKVPAFLYFFAKPSNVNGVWLDSLDYQGENLLVVGNIEDINKFPLFLKITEEKLGDILFKDARMQVYEDRKSGIKVIYYKFDFGVRLKNGSTH